MTSPYKICASDAAIKEGIAAEYTVGVAHKADATGSVTRSVQHLERECAKGDRISLFQQNIWFSLYERRWTIEHLCGAFICIHKSIGGMDIQWHPVDSAHLLALADGVDLTMSVDELFSDES